MDFFLLCNNHFWGVRSGVRQLLANSKIEQQRTNTQSHRKTQPNAGRPQVQMKGTEVAQRNGHPKVGEDGKEARYACICQSPKNSRKNDLQGVEELIDNKYKDEVCCQLGHLCFGRKEKGELNFENQEKQADDEDHQQNNVHRCPGSSLQ